jgi:alkylated DNA repair protein (DNA oxidative demethylase)
MPDLFATAAAAEPWDEMIAPGSVLLRGFALPFVNDVLAAFGGAGYRYDRIDPETGEPWPALPECFRELASRAADRAGYPGFVPDACLINRYAPGTRLTLHQDRDERDYAHPIVSVSLGLPATFQFGGPKRRDPMRSLLVRHGDVLVWGGVSRLAYHGVAELKSGEHPLFGNQRINLTFRRAL